MSFGSVGDVIAIRASEHKFLECANTNTSGTSYDNQWFGSMAFPIRVEPPERTQLTLMTVFQPSALTSTTSRALPGSITEPSPGRIVIEGGRELKESVSKWSMIVGAAGTGAHNATLTTRWKITIQEGEQPPP